MSGMWKRSHGRTSEAPPDERGGYRYVRPTATAPHLDSTQHRRCRVLRRRSLHRTICGPCPEIGFRPSLGISPDSPLEEAGFEPSVPRDTPKFSTPAHVTCLTPCTRKSRREREPILRGCRPPPAEPMVRIRLPPPASLPRGASPGVGVGVNSVDDDPAVDQ